MIRLLESGRAGVMDLDGNDLTQTEIAEQKEGLPADPADLPLERCAVPVDAATAAAVTGAWRTMLEEVRPGEEQLAGADGVTYRFAMAGEGGRPLAGEVWTPRGGSRTAALARLAETMRSPCAAPRASHLRRILGLARRLARRGGGAGC